MKSREKNIVTVAAMSGGWCGGTGGAGSGQIRPSMPSPWRLVNKAVMIFHLLLLHYSDQQPRQNTTLPTSPLSLRLNISIVVNGSK